MAKRYVESPECALASLDLGSTPPTCSSILSVQYEAISPLYSIADSSTLPLEFFVAGTPEYYIDLANSIIEINCALVHEDNTPVGPDEKTSVVNNLGHSLFSQCNLFLNDTLLSENDNMYSFKSYILDSLSYGHTAKNTFMKTQLYIDDTAGRFHINDPITGIPVNYGLVARSMICKKPMQLIIRPHVDMFNQNRALIPGIDVRLRFARSTSDFMVISAETDKKYKIKINSATFHVRQLQVLPEIALGHQHLLKSGKSVKYPIVRVSCSSYTIMTGVLSDHRGNLYLGHLPKRVILGITKNQNFNGTLGTNAFHFGVQNVSSMQLSVNGRGIPSKPIMTSYSDDGEGEIYNRAYYLMMSGLHKTVGGDELYLTPEQWRNGYGFYVFQISEDYHSNEMFGMERSGSMSLDIVFRKPTTEPLSVVCLYEFQNIIEIKAGGVVLLDYRS